MIGGLTYNGMSVLTDGASMQMYLNATGFSNWAITPQANPPPPPPLPPGTVAAPNTPMQPPYVPSPAIKVALPYHIEAANDPMLVCRSDNATSNVYCGAGAGLILPEQFVPYHPGDPFITTDIPENSELVIHSALTGKWCRAVQISLTRQGMICDRDDMADASTLIYYKGTLAMSIDSTLKMFITDGEGWPGYFTTPGVMPLSKFILGPLQPPSPPPPPPMPPTGDALIPKACYSIFDLSSSMYCRATNATSFVSCQSGTGRTSPEVFLPCRPEDVTLNTPIAHGDNVILMSNASQMFCRVAPMTLTRQGVICDQMDPVGASVLVYSFRGLK
jgi:hypothetical protein